MKNRKYGKSICFIGLDGSGKSTSIDAAYEFCVQNNIPVKIVRAAYVVEKLNKIIKIGKKITMKKHSDPFKDGDYANYLSELRKTNTKSFKYRVFSFLTTIEFKQQIRKRIKNNLKKGYFLLIDRYIYDNAVTYAANLGLDELFMKDIIGKKWKKAPKPDSIIYVKTSPDICMTRKTDIPDILYLEIRKPLYDKIAEMYDATVISGEQNKDSMIEETIRTVSEVFYGK